MNANVSPGILSITVSSDDQQTVVWLLGEFDAAGCGEYDVVVDPLIAANPGVVVIDMGGLTFIDAAGLGRLAETQARLAADGGRLRVRRCGHLVRRLIDITGLSTVIEVEE